MENKTALTVDTKMVAEPISITMDDVRKYICESATDKEIALFINIAKVNGLNPFKREIYLVKYGSYPASILTGYETYIKRAERTGKLTGWKAWTEGDKPDMKACIEIKRKDFESPFYHEVEYSEYVGKTKEGVPTRFWNEKPKTMLKKVVISQGFRLCFSDELGGLPYTQDEMNVVDADKVSTKPVVAMPKEVKKEEPTKPVKAEDFFEVAPDEPVVDVHEDITVTPEKSKANLQNIRDLMAKCYELSDLKNLWEQETKDHETKFTQEDYEKADKSKEYFKRILENKIANEKKNGKK